MLLCFVKGSRTAAASLFMYNIQRAFHVNSWSNNKRVLSTRSFSTVGINPLLDSSSTNWEANRHLHRKYLDWIANQLNIQKSDDWYQVQSKDLSPFGGLEFLKQCYHNSLSKGKISQTIYELIAKFVLPYSSTSR